MKNIKQAGMLITILAMPAFIFVMVKLFSTNHFVLDVYFPGKEMKCPPNLVDSAHVVADFEFINLDENKTSSLNGNTLLKDKVTIVHLQDDTVSTKENIEPLINSLKSISFEFKNKNVSVLSLMALDSGLTSQFHTLYQQIADSDKGRWVYGSVDKELMKHISECRLYLVNIKNKIEPKAVAMIDSKRRIRGFYDLTDTEHIDRMHSELMILLKEENDGANSEK